MKFHHIGFVVDNIKKYEQQMLFKEKINEVEDSIQKAKLALYRNFGDSYLELVEPLSEDSFTWNSLKKYGNHFHHLCYEVENLDILQRMKEEQKWIEVLKPVPAILFENKLVAFYFMRNRQIVEFLILN